MSDGKGVFYYLNGERFEGTYKNDKREGDGTIYDGAGIVKLRALYQDNQVVKNLGVESRSKTVTQTKAYF